MLLLSNVLCYVRFLLLILPHNLGIRYRKSSYPPAIRKRVESLPQYKDILAVTKNKNILRKIIGAVIAVFLLAGLAYFSGKTDFISAFIHVFILFSVVNLYDLIVLDLIVFAHCEKVVIPGTEDMVKEYKNPIHHIKGACKGFLSVLLLPPLLLE